MAAKPTFWDAHFTPPIIQSDGAELPLAQVLNFVGGGAEYNAAQERIDITAGGGGGGETNTGANVGAGAGVFKDKSGVSLRFRTLIAGANVTLTQNADTISIAAAAAAGLAAATLTFPSNANHTLTAPQDAATMLVVADGVITTERTITSPSAPATSAWKMIQNLNRFSIAFKWSTGTSVWIEPGATVIVGSDGTNATFLAQAPAIRSGAGDFAAVSFSADADQSLTYAQSIAPVLTIAGGTTPTATRKLTSLCEYTPGQVIRNEWTYDVDFQLAGSSIVTRIPRGQVAIVQYDGRVLVRPQYPMQVERQLLDGARTIISATAPAGWSFPVTHLDEFDANRSEIHHGGSYDIRNGPNPDRIAAADVTWGLEYIAHNTNTQYWGNLGGGNHEVRQGAGLQTTNATPTTLLDLFVLNDASLDVELTISAVANGNPEPKATWRIKLACQTSGGPVTIEDDETDAVKNTGASTWNVQLDTGTSQHLIVRAVGQAATTITWRITATWRNHQ